jgi:transcriptional regulator with XRE-family HTH domain
MKFPSNAEGAMGVLADRIRQARRIANLSQAELAESLDVASSAVAQWESPNGTTPRIERIQALATAVGVSVQWLLTGRSDESRRYRALDEEIPAMTPDSFARDIDEEVLLKQFRRMPARARGLFMSLLVEFGRGAVDSTCRDE